jgi:hypothetical protein
MNTKKQATLDLTGRKAGKANIDDAVSALRHSVPPIAQRVLASL